MAGLSLGDRLGRYELTAELGQGGMSVVYRARDTQLHREVAVKVMHDFLADQPESRERFRREAVAVANLHHPHIIEIFDFASEEAGTIYMVAELIDGTSLADFIDGRALAPPEAALILARPLADALAHAHEAGVIHRDIKPENVLVDTKGALKLTDFGIARMLDNQTLTMTGTLLGSPAYMAPEYIDGQTPDERSDLFSFGAMLYQLVTGALPFTGPSPHALLKRIAACEFQPVDQRSPGVHAAIVRVIHRCLRRDPAERYASAASLVANIDAILDRIGIDPDVERPLLLTDPSAYGEALAARLPTTYANLGRAAMAAGETGRAMEDFDRVLTMDPHHAEVRRILGGINRRAWLRRVARDAALAVGGAALLTAAWVGLAPLFAATPAPPPPAPPAIAEPDPVDSRRQVWVEVAGVGDVTVDGELCEDAQISGEQFSGRISLLLEPGAHNVRVVGQEKTDEEEIVVPETGRTPEISLDVSVAPPVVPTPPKAKPRPKPQSEAPKLRRVTFRFNGWAHIFREGSDTPLAKDAVSPFATDLPYGRQVLRFVNDYSKPKEVEILVDDNHPPGAVTVQLEPKDAYLRIAGLPGGGSVIIEVAGKVFHLTDVNASDPILVPLNAGRDLSVRVRREGFAPWETQTHFKPGETYVIEPRLRPL